VKGEHNVYPNPHLAIIPNTKNKEEYTHTIILNIKKKIKNHIPQKNENEKICKKTTSILHIQINGLTL